MTPIAPVPGTGSTEATGRPDLTVDARPLLRVVGAREVAAQREQQFAAQVQAERDAQMRSTVVQGLATHLRSLWETARNERSATNLEQRLLKCMYTRKSEYDPEKLSSIKMFGGSDVYAGITANKIRAIVAWMKDVLIDQLEKPWGVEHTAIPELSPEVVEELQGLVETEIHAWMVQTGVVPMQQIVNMYYRVIYDEMYNRTKEEAKVRAERMENLIEDQFTEGGFYEQFALFLDDYCTFPSAVFKGPIPMKMRDLKWQMGPDGSVAPAVTEKVKLSFKRVSPFDLFPSPSAETTQEGYLFEKHRLSTSELYNYIGVNGYNEAAIRAVLDEAERGSMGDWLTVPLDYQRRAAEDRSSLHNFGKREPIIDALEFWGPVSGKMLQEWGAEVDDAQRVYEVNAWLIKDWVIFAEVNPNPMGRRPYYKSSFDPIPGAFWGQSLVDILDDAQQIVNASARASVNNMGFASGPMVGVNAERISPGTQIDRLQPWQMFKFQNDPMGTNGAPPIQFFQPQSNVAELSALQEKYYALADDLSGLPRYMQGSNSSASRTASGLSMLINAASKSMKQLIAHVSRDIISQVVKDTYTHNMLYHPDDAVKGDLNVIARGASAAVHKEAVQARRNEFMAATMNPIDAQIMGPEGRAALLRESAQGLDIDPNLLVPSLDKQRYAMASAAIAGMGGGQQPPAQGPGGEVLQDGMNTPTVDTFAPQAQGGAGQ